MVEQSILKKSMFGGFNKSDVLNYIDRMNENAREEEDRLNIQINELEEKNAFLAEQLLGLQKHMEETEKKLAEETEKSNALTETKKSLETELFNMRYSDQQHQRDLEFEREKSRQLEMSLSLLEEKAKSYDGLSSQIGDILVEARLESSKLLDSTKTQCDIIAQSTNRSLLSAVDQIGALDMQFGSMQEQVQCSIDQIKQQFDDIRQQLMQTQDTLTGMQMSDESEEDSTPSILSVEEETSSLFAKAAAESEFESEGEIKREAE